MSRDWAENWNQWTEWVLLWLKLGLQCLEQMIKHHRNIPSCTERTEVPKICTLFLYCYKFLSTFKKLFNTLSQQTLPDAQTIVREREEGSAFSLKVKMTNISEYFGFYMIKWGVYQAIAHFIISEIRDWAWLAKWSLLAIYFITIGGC